MNLERKILLALVLIAVSGWLAVAVLSTSAGTSKLRAVSAETDAANWKRQAGKAYTELLKARVGTDTAVLIPTGARIDCTDDRTTSECAGGTIYPPRDY